MPPPSFTIKPFEQKYKQQLVTVWERSVLATHDFLKPSDFNEIKEAVQGIDFTAFPVYCLVNENDQVGGFIGVAEQKMEMLFLDPDNFGSGLGKRLTQFAITQLGADKVDVNEQNTNAVHFYQKAGFEVYERTDKDDQGKNYPLLRMKLKK